MEDKKAEAVVIDDLKKIANAAEEIPRNNHFSDKNETQKLKDLEKKIHEEVSNKAIGLSRDIFGSWNDKEKEEKALRKHYLKWVISLLIGQLVISNTIIIFIGFNILQISNEVIYAFFSFVFVEIIGLLIILFKYLYSERQTSVLDISYKIIEAISRNNNDFNKTSHTNENYYEEDRKKYNERIKQFTERK